jgi:tRNA A37 threonylcarbamoyladenosine modification protein TsaB
LKSDGFLAPSNAQKRKPTFAAAMEAKKGSIDIINEVLEACIMAYPVSSFIISLYKQYISRGWLTKGQLQGLYSKAQMIKDLSPGKLAALEALINKMPTRTKSEAPKEATPLYTKDESTGQLIEAILAKYPQHKRVLFLQAKYNNNETLTATELADLKRFSQLLKKD